jgi:hypothetical protein
MSVWVGRSSNGKAAVKMFHLILESPYKGLGAETE